ncbi:MAG: PTS transporter subunit EIIC [Erysipelotrichaceae bacterium]|nr:PTS transporter subunit EIIC [Erysipelotrichaceae bacterium]
MADYRKTAAEIVEKLGGKENISGLVHCATRLRFTLKNYDVVDDTAVKAVKGVLGTQKIAGQYQIIIGQEVPDVYREVCALAGISESAAIDENLDQGKKKFNASEFFAMISSIFAPCVPAFAGAGVLKGLLTLCSNFGWLDTASGTYLMLNAAGDALFYFLPFILAYTSAVRFKTNIVISLILAGLYMYPNVINNAGTQVSIFGIPTYLVKYSSTVLPIVASVFILSKIYPWLEKKVPSYLRVVLVPLCSILIMAPISLVLVGPLGYNVGLYVGKFFGWLFDTAPWLGGFIDGFTRPLVVFTGTHMTLSAVMINNIQTLGYDMLGPVHCVATMAAAGMCFGAFLKAKDPDNKSSIFSSFISAFIGITEPALYGCAFRFKKPLYALMIGGGVSGAFVAALGAKAISFAMPSIISLPVYSGSIPTMLIGLLIAFVLTAVLTYVFGFDEEIKKDARAIEAEKKNIL